MVVSIITDSPEEIQQNYAKASHQMKEGMRQIWNQTGRLDHIRGEKRRTEAGGGLCLCWLDGKAVVMRGGLCSEGF